MRPIRANNNLRAGSGSDPVEVFCRVRPLPEGVDESCVNVPDPQTVELTVSATTNRPVKQIEAKFTQVFCDRSSQSEIFDRVADDLVEDLVRGKNGLLFTYGITGSGKTFTMTGNPADAGILPRSLDVLFNSIDVFQTGADVFIPDGYNGFGVQTEAAAAINRGRQALTAAFSNDALNKATPRRKRAKDDDDEWELRPREADTRTVRGVDEDRSYAVFVSYVEIYNNYIYDLLDEENEKKPQSRITKEDVNGNKYVSGVTEVEVKSTDDAFAVFIRGQKQRRVAHTVLNTESSRSHSVFNVRLVQAPLDYTGADVVQDNTKVHVSQLSLVDLAGSERTKRTGNVGDRMQETGNINKSLMYLRQCIAQLRENQQNGCNNLVPYNNSKLTSLFKNYFDGQGKVRMVVCLNPQINDDQENLFVVQFAEMTQEVEVVRANELAFEMDGLTPGRRRAALFEQELGMAAPMQSTPNDALIFDQMPRVDLDDPTDEQPIMAYRRYFEQKQRKRQEMMAVAAKKQEEFMSLMRKAVFENESTRSRFDELKTERNALDKDNRRLMGSNRQLQHQVASLTQRLAKYEDDVRHQIDQGELYRKKERDMAAEVHKKQWKLNQVRQIFETGAKPTNTPPRFGTKTANNGGSITPSARFGGSQDSLSSRARTATTQPSEGSLYPSLSARSRPVNRAGRRAPSPPPKPAMHMNTRHRRSKSVTGIIVDHQPSNKVPTGTFMQPKVRGRKVNKMEMQDLNKATGYVLTHQDTDPKTGTLRTSLVKGDVLPTSGGGSAVVFDDVEQLTHKSPGRKRKSDDENSNSSGSGKRTRRRD